MIALIYYPPYKKVLGWMEDTKIATNPHFKEVLNILRRAKEKFEQQLSRVAEIGIEISNKIERHSKMSKLCLHRFESQKSRLQISIPHGFTL